MIAGVGSNDTRHAVELTERATELGADALLSVNPYYNRPSRRGIIAHYKEVVRATELPIVLYNIPQRTASDMPNDLLAELAQLDHICGVKQANPANLAKIDGMIDLRRQRRHARRRARPRRAGRSPHRQPRVRRRDAPMVDEPERRREIDASLQDAYRDLGDRAGRVQPQGGAGDDRGPGRRARGCPTSSSTPPSSPSCARCSNVTACCRWRPDDGARAGDGGVSNGKLRVLPLGGLGEIGKNMTVVEYDDRIVVVDTGLRFPTAEQLGIDLVLPDFAYLRSRADEIEAIVITHGHEDHLGALPWILRELGAEDAPPVYGGPLTIAMARSKLDEHNLREVELEDLDDRRADRARTVRARARAHDPLDPRLVCGRAAAPSSGRCC